MSLSSTVTFQQDDAKLFFHDKCDRYDYLIAVGCGALAGLVDVFLVGAPSKSVIGNWTDAQADKFVKFFAEKQGWKPREGKEDSIGSAIGFLEKEFPVNYDHRHSGDVNNLFTMSTTNHHLKSLAHSPSVVGLFFSILNQFTSTASFASGGMLITIKTETFELQGSNFISRLFCGCVNWFGHIISDMAGSSGSRGNSGGRGSGVAIPFFELFQFCNFGSFQVGKDRQDLATLATRVFQEGYDLRFGAAMAIPVVLNELLIRTIWALKRYFYHKAPLKDCLPILKHDNLRIMLIVGHGTLCVIDGMDAGIRSGGNAVSLVLRLNLIAWYRLTWLVLKEVFIRLRIAADVQQQLDSYKIINEEFRMYLAKLEKIDFKRFTIETSRYNQMIYALEQANDAEALNTVLREKLAELGVALPWEGEFDEFMQDKSSRLTFGG
ncbi:hypothetical protein [Paenibacillus sp. MER 99-2]|uniref:hypothetical protein n=1 Tax=Paenibacillus sp. MER 99-2 TaxID=2939572 RepID=UPI00203D48DC|nr:hypothetical protein [Paenibacillus sp. MER 99-2]MCM3174396.1 hypothetical protein [Paenibacillus sp. MER 99-2]